MTTPDPKVNAVLALALLASTSIIVGWVSWTTRRAVHRIEAVAGNTYAEGYVDGVRSGHPHRERMLRTMR